MNADQRELPELLQEAADSVQASIADSQDGPCVPRRSYRIELEQRLREARKALLSETVQAIPKGWRLVPEEPTEEMKVAGWLALKPGADDTLLGDAYRAMLAAAPQPNAATQGSESSRSQSGVSPARENVAGCPALAAPSPLGSLDTIVAEYDSIVNGRLDPRDAEADFVMRGSDWREIRKALAAPSGKPEAEHVCGLQGFNPMIDPPCPGCEARRKTLGQG